MGKILREIHRHLANIPSFRVAKATQVIDHPHLEKVNRQIEEAIKENDQRLVFLLGPFGGGKTTQIDYFLKKHKEYLCFYRSFVKVSNLDFGFLHLTSYIGHLVIVTLFFIFAILLMKKIPALAPLPILLMIGYFFIKNPGNLVYIVYETWNSLFRRKHKLVVIEDFERSSLSFNDQWALLSNLWHYKTTYLITLGYSPEEKKSKLKLMESALKLGGAIVEIPLNKEVNCKLIKAKEPDFPFNIEELKSQANGNWLGLFTPREILLIQEQVLLRKKTEIAPHKRSPEEEQFKCLQVYLDFLLEKLGVTSQKLVFDEKKKAIHGISSDSFSPEQQFFIDSFIRSSLLKIEVKLGQ